MVLLILESIGTQELILVGTVALIVFGPRKLPSMAKKAGGFLNEMRSVSNDFKSTWEEEARKTQDVLKMGEENSIKPNPDTETVKRDEEIPILTADNSVKEPKVKELSKEDYEKLKSTAELTNRADTVAQSTSKSDKETWL